MSATGEGSEEDSPRAVQSAALAGAAGMLEQLGDAVVAADRAGTIVFANGAATRLLGYRTADLVGQPVIMLVPARLQRAHQAGFDRFVSTGERHLRPGAPIRVAAVRADGTEVPIELLLGALGRPGDPGFVVVATLRDVSERVALESRATLSEMLQAAIDALRDGVLAVSPDLRVLAVNRRWSELWRLPPGSIKVGEVSPTLGAESLSRVADPASFEAAIRWGRAHPREAHTIEVALVDGRVLEGYAAPILDAGGEYHGRALYLHDDTERRAAEARLVAAERTQRFLLDASAVVGRSSGYAETLDALARVAVPILGDLCLIDVLDESGDIERIAAVHADAALQLLASQLRRFPPDLASSHPIALTIRDGTSRFSGDMTRELLQATTRGSAHLAILEQLGVTSYVTVPLVTDGATLGALTMVSAGSGRRFGREDLALVEELAGRAAAVVAKERRFEAQRTLAHALQASLLPAEPPDLRGVEVAVRYLPATSGAEVGGDFWDITALPEGGVALAVGDVEGHDMTAAATMAQLRSAARALRASEAADPAELIRLLQSAWAQLGLERIATAAFARLDPGHRTLQVASAGHLPPLMVEPGRAWYLPVEPAPPLGAPPAAPILYQATWPRDAALVLYTDGLVEDRTTGLGEGLRRLQDMAGASGSSDPQVIIERLVGALAAETLGDDVALLVIRPLRDCGQRDDGRGIGRLSGERRR